LWYYAAAVAAALCFLPVLAKSENPRMQFYIGELVVLNIVTFDGRF
jgi:hypothetical protein